MQIGEHQFDRRNLKLGVNVDWNSTAIISYRNGPVDVDSYIDSRAKAGQVLIDRVVENLKNAVVQPSLVRIADIHPGPFPDRL
jgi:hypothetical protein